MHLTPRVVRVVIVAAYFLGRSLLFPGALVAAGHAPRHPCLEVHQAGILRSTPDVRTTNAAGSTGSRICHGNGTSNFANHPIYITNAPICLPIHPANSLLAIIVVRIQVVLGTLYLAGDAMWCHILILHTGQAIQALYSTTGCLATATIGNLQLGVVGAAGALAQLALGVVGASVGAANRI